MVARQSFNDFLNSGGPSTPRGRGRGRGGGGGFRGGGGGRGGYTPGGGGQSKNSFNADYTNMAFDYERINSQKYTKMEGFSVQPFGPSPTPSGASTPRGGRGAYTPRGAGGRGGGRGNTPSRGGGHHHHQNQPHTPSSLHTPQTPSGAATPVHGLGYHDVKSEVETRGKGDHRGLGMGHAKSTVGKGMGNGTITWGGGKAPLFVKAGELFKDGEADVITMGKDHKLHIEALPMSDPSAPQMTDLRDETEIDIVGQPLTPESAPSSSDAEHNATDTEQQEFTFEVQDQAESSDLEETGGEDALEQLLAGTVGIEVAEVPTVTDDIAEIALKDEQDTAVATSSPSIAVQVDHLSNASGLEAVPSDVEIQEDEPFTATSEPMVEIETPLFFVDTDPAPIDEVPIPTYEAVSSLPLGTEQIPAPVSDEEQIVFVPKTYKKPEAFTLNISSAPAPGPASSSEAPFTSRAFVNPRAMSRAEKKAAKREKRRGNKSKAGKKARKRQERVPREDSDLEWGSDGPPPIITGVEGAETDDEDMAILRDYMEGTKLNAKTEREEMIAAGELMEEDEEGADSDEDSGIEAEEMDIQAIRLFGRGIKGLTEGGQEIIDEDDDDSEDESGSEASIELAEDDEDDSEEDDDDGEDDSSVLGELDIEGMMSDDDEDIEELFNGTSQWNNETDWFINAMEDALDGPDVDMRDRKSRSKVFKAIEDGDFGDDWGLEPCKKSKKDKHIPPQLQAQWEKDRKAKAEKKLQRELERLIAEIDPDRSGYSRKGKAKAKGKGKAKAHQAAVAHLIPASAGQVADLFDVSSDDEEDISGMPIFRKGGRLPSGLPLEIVDHKIQMFLEDKGKNSLALPPMDKEGRKKVHMLAEAYGLKSKSRGSGKTRFPVLIKTKRSGRLIDERKIERLLSASSQSGGGFYKALYSKGAGGGGKGVKGRPSAGPSIRHKEGDMVGHGAERIGMDNIGHKLLSKMGWAEGDKIGLGSGLEAPIVAIVKNTKSGLGA
ncbi:hypothetical protein IAT40_005265 [Kwoniella sp. CBS 6097]